MMRAVVKAAAAKAVAHPAPGLSRSRRRFLFATVAISGAAVLVVEILGSRLISPFFGSSLNVWSSIIATTLLALAAGYALGGVAADRPGRMDVLYGLLLAAAMNLILVPLMRGPVLEAASGLGPQLGALAAAVALLFPPLTMLGAVSPLAFKIATENLQSLGRTVGYLSTVSTLGSVAGALLAGFYLVSELGTRNVCWLVSAVLALPAISYFLQRRSLAGGGGAGLWAALWIVALAARPDGLYAGQGISVIDRAESLYGELLIVDWRGARFLIVDGTSQGVFSIADGRSVNPYEKVMAAVLRGWRDLQGTQEMQGILCGLGPGAFPSGVSDIARIEVFELDPRVAQMAAKHFGFDPARHLVSIGDGRQLARAHAPATADFVAIDAYASDVVPTHMVSTEAVATFKRLLKPGGLMLLNTIGIRDGKGSEGLKSIQATVGASFAHRFLLAVIPGEDFGNFVLAASETPLDALRARLPELGRLEVVFPPGSGTVLTDDRNPIDRYWRETARRMRENLWKSVPHELILS